MTLRYAFIPVLFLALTVQAQRVHSKGTLLKPAPVPTNTHGNSVAGGERDGGDIVFSEDFANGLNGNNGIGAWTLSGAHGSIWKHTSAGPNGAYIGSGGPNASRIQSTTVSNGYMLFNSDSANSTWSNGTPTALPTTQFTSWDGSLESPVLNLQATPYVEIEFQQRLRYCCGSSPHFLEVSTDGGFSWPVRFNTAEGATTNNITATEVKKFNLTAAIEANPQQVRFRFRHDSEAGTSHYHWQIDDIKIVELYEYDMRITDAGNTHWDNSTAMTYDSLHYTIFPFSQLRPMGLNMNVLNNGSSAQEATANFTVERGGTTVLNQDQFISEMTPGEIRRIFVDPQFVPPAEAGIYTVTYSIDTDQDDMTPGDNVATSSFRVHEHLYARDAGAPYAWETGNEQTMIIGNMFHVYNNATLYGISVKIGTGSAVNSFVVGQLRADDLETILNETQEYTITTASMSGPTNETYVDLMFDIPVQLTAGQDYMVSVYTFGNVRVGESGVSAPFTSFLYYAPPNQSETWFYTTTTPAVRMNFNATVGINDLVKNSIQARSYPNPSNGTTRLDYVLHEAAPVTVELVDISGKVVRTYTEGTRAPGHHQLVFDVSNLQEGVYFHVLRAGDSKVTGRLVVVK